MFTLQNGRLTAAGFTPQQVAVLASCSQSLAHRGNVLFDYNGGPGSTTPAVWGRNNRGLPAGRFDGNVEVNGDLLLDGSSEAIVNMLAPRLQFRNDSGETIPPYAVLKITGFVNYKRKLIATCDKPDTDFERYYYVNGGKYIGDGGYGQCSQVGLARVLYDDGGADPVFGNVWGAKAGEWALFPNRCGFRVMGIDTSNLTLLTDQEKIHHIRGILDEDLLAGAAADLVISMDGTPSEYTVSVGDDLIQAGQKIESGELIHAKWLEQDWWLDNTNACPVPQ